MKVTAQKAVQSLQIRDCGLSVYRELLEVQHDLVRQRRSGQIGNTVLITEHQPVITLGARKSENKLLVGKEVLAEKKIDIEPVRRGGGTTAHNPGQLVFYPILNLQMLGLGINEYIRKLEQIGIELLAEFGLGAQRKNRFPGLWVGQKKIASIGVRVSRGVTYHGMAINIRNDLTIFELIIPCGLDGVAMTSLLNETGKEDLMPQAKRKLIRELIEHFSDKDSACYEDCS